MVLQLSIPMVVDEGSLRVMFTQSVLGACL